MEILLLSKVLPKEICDIVATYLKRTRPFVLYDPRFVVLKGLQLEYLYTNHGRYIFKIVRDSHFDTQRFLDFHAYACTPFWRNMHEDLILAVGKIDTTRYTKGRYYICDVEFLLIGVRNMFREPQYDAIIARKRIREDRFDF